MDVLTSVLFLLLGAAQVVTLVDKTVVETLYNTSGIIEAPADPSGAHGYQPNARYLWIMDMQKSNVNIEVTVEEMDLGFFNYAIHTIDDDEIKVNFTKGDFILVGAGSDVLQGNELMFFGSRTKPKTVIVRSGLAHIYFYSTTIAADTVAKGFTISYNVTEMASTLPPPTTTTPKPPSLAKAIISIKGIPVDDWFSYNNDFKLVISNMASDYVLESWNMTQVNVTPSEVQINTANYCHPDYCPVDTCVAYDFSIATERDEVVVFQAKDLEHMLAEPSANQYIEEVFGATYQICDDDPSISIVLYVVIPLAVVVFGVAITYAAWKLSGKSTVMQAQEKYEQAQKEKIEDQRRRSSGDISILGLGGRSIASRGSRSSRRFTMPFPKPGHDEVDHGADQEEQEVDTTGFVFYDPDQPIIDPAQFGLGGVVSEFTRKGQRSHQYTNEAFVMDEENAIALHRLSFNNNSDSDTDSDNGGAISFQPKRELIPRVQFEVPADVHSPDIEGDTTL